MTQEKIKQEIEEIEARIQQEWATWKEKIEKANSTTKLGVPYYLKKETTIDSEALHNITPDEIVENMQDFKEDVKNLPKHFGGNYTTWYNFYDNEVYDSYIEYRYSTLQSLEGGELHRIAINKYKRLIAKRLKPKGTLTAAMIDCKLFQMFLSKDISLEQLGKLTYGECEL